MKTGIVGLVTMTLVLSACSSSSDASRSVNKAVDFERTASLIESGNYQFAVLSATPAGGRTIQITSSYVMKASDGAYETRLPYFGRSYSAGYGEGGSVEFSGEPENLQIERNDNKFKLSLTFSIRSRAEKYDVMLSVGASGHGNLIVSSSGRNTITYYGLAGALDN